MGQFILNFETFLLMINDLKSEILWGGKRPSPHNPFQGSRFLYVTPIIHQIQHVVQKTLSLKKRHNVSPSQQHCHGRYTILFIFIF